MIPNEMRKLFLGSFTNLLFYLNSQDFLLGPRDGKHVIKKL